MTKIKCTFSPSVVDRFGKNRPKEMDFDYINYPLSDEDFIEQLKDADILFCGPMEFITKKIIEGGKKLKLIQSIGAGYDKIDLEYARQRGIYVCANRGANAIAVAEQTILLMLSCLKKLPYADARIKSGHFNDVFEEYRANGHCELGACTVGLIGMGAIGKMVAKFLHAFGAKIMYNDVVRADQDFEELYNVQFMEREEIYKGCDIISYHVPVLPATTGILNKEAIAKMKENVILINVSRGEIVNNEDLAEALNAKKVIAGLDVVAPEPPDEKTHPLLNLTQDGNDRLTITPHMAGTTDNAFQRMCDWAYANMVKVMNGERPDNIVNGL